MVDYGSLSPLYRIFKGFWAAFRKSKRSLSRTEVIPFRQTWKAEIEAKIWERRKAGLRPDVVVRDVQRMDSYPESDGSSKGLSPWFRVALLGTYYRGIRLGLRAGTLTREKNTGAWRYTNYNAGERGEINVILIGYVPYENIEAVDWDGDECYGFPHLYCHFDTKRKEPYERCVFCEEKRLDDLSFYPEVAEYESVYKQSRKAGIEYFT